MIAFLKDDSTYESSQSNFYPLANHKIICNCAGNTDQYTKINVFLEFLKFKFDVQAHGTGRGIYIPE